MLAKYRGILDTLLVPFIVVLGIMERVAWNVLRPGFSGEGEAMNVALAVADGRGFADAYRLGQGPTAHLLPVSPGFAGAVYYVFGARSVAAEIVLASWSIGLAIGTYLLLYRAFSYLGVPRLVRVAGLAFGCLAPTYISQEAVDFRVWEGGLAIFLTALFLERLLAASIAPRDDAVSPYRRPVILAGCAAMLFFVNPLLGLAALGCLAIFGLRNWSVRQMAATVGAAAAVLAVTVGPWTLRNAQVLGKPVLLRSNGGLELALTNYPEAAATKDERGEFLRHMGSIHPTMNVDAYRKMKRMGEVEYFDSLGKEAVDWVEREPVKAGRLWLHHLREMVFPSNWKFDADGNSKVGWIKALLAQFVGIFGIAGAIVLFVRRPGGGALYPAIVVALTALAVGPFQPVVRYTYLIYPIMVSFMACTLLVVPRLNGAGRRAAKA